jgi:hypothetical protein
MPTILTKQTEMLYVAYFTAPHDLTPTPAWEINGRDHLRTGIHKAFKEASDIRRLEKENPKMANVMKSQQAKRKAAEAFVARSKKR